jgi:nitrite reductase/ring-hydroxylating ferredoxin subunit
VRRIIILSFRVGTGLVGDTDPGRAGFSASVNRRTFFVVWSVRTRRLQETSMSPDDRSPLTRRGVLTASAGAALGLPLLAACSSDGSSDAGSGSSSGSSSGSGSSGSGGSGSKGEELAKTSEVPVGGGVSAKTSDGQPVIVAQPSKGQFVAFSAICTHQGCTVAPSGDIIKCPCHGSTYDLATGDNTGGPAPSPLPKISVTVKGGAVVES